MFEWQELVRNNLGQFLFCRFEWVDIDSFHYLSEEYRIAGISGISAHEDRLVGRIGDIALRGLAHGRAIALRITSTSIKSRYAVLKMVCAHGQPILPKYAKSDRGFSAGEEISAGAF
jgi:hypothetical protein